MSLPNHEPDAQPHAEADATVRGDRQHERAVPMRPRPPIRCRMQHDGTALATNQRTGQTPVRAVPARIHDQDALVVHV